MYGRRPRSVNDLQLFIRDAISQINSDEDLMKKVLVAFKHRMHLIIENEGNHIEHLKKKDLASSDETAGARTEDDAIQLPNDHFVDEDVYPDGN